MSDVADAGGEDGKANNSSNAMPGFASGLGWPAQVREHCGVGHYSSPDRESAARNGPTAEGITRWMLRIEA